MRCTFELAMVVMLAACGATTPPSQPPVAAATSPAERPITSNVTRADYVGSAACTPCHAEVAAKFEGSPMHRMTRIAETTDIHAPFDGGVFHFGAESVRFEGRGVHRFMVVERPGEASVTYHVTKVIGGHYREDFVGQRVAAVSDDPGPSDAQEVVLPATWHFRHGEWRYKGYSVQIPERPAMSVGPPWAKSCIFCHNTEPYLSTILDDLGHYAKKTYQGSTPRTSSRPTAASTTA